MSSGKLCSKIKKEINCENSILLLFYYIFSFSFNIIRHKTFNTFSGNSICLPPDILGSYVLLDFSFRVSCYKLLFLTNVYQCFAFTSIPFCFSCGSICDNYFCWYKFGTQHLIRGLTFYQIISKFVKKIIQIVQP